MAKKKKRSIYDRITYKYQVIIRNEENFAEKTTFSFNYAQALLVFFILFSGMLFMSLFLAKSILSQWYDPAHEDKQVAKDVEDIRQRLDSLNHQLVMRDEIIHSFHVMLDGGVTEDSVVTASKNDEREQDVTAVDVESRSEADSLIRSRFEQAEGVAPTSESVSGVVRMYFPPVEGGEVIVPYDPEKGQFGVRIEAKGVDMVKAIADGRVILSLATVDGAILAVQHRHDAVSVYRHNGELLKKVGEFVRTGEPLAALQSGAPFIDFELWEDRSRVNPVDFIEF